MCQLNKVFWSNEIEHGNTGKEFICSNCCRFAVVVHFISFQIHLGKQTLVTNKSIPIRPIPATFTKIIISFTTYTTHARTVKHFLTFILLKVYSQNMGKHV